MTMSIDDPVGSFSLIEDFCKFCRRDKEFEVLINTYFTNLEKYQISPCYELSEPILISYNSLYYFLYGRVFDYLDTNEIVKNNTPYTVDEIITFTLEYLSIYKGVPND